jgi:hypothetical protein
LDKMSFSGQGTGNILIRMVAVKILQTHLYGIWDLMLNFHFNWTEL